MYVIEYFISESDDMFAFLHSLFSKFYSLYVYTLEQHGQLINVYHTNTKYLYNEYLLFW